MSPRKVRKKHIRLSSERIHANEVFVWMQAVARDLRAAAERAQAVNPAQTRLALQELRDTLWALQPLRGDAAKWPYPFAKRKFAICRAVLWAHRHHPTETDEAVRACMERLQKISSPETAE